jgi:hypothetical protein
MRIWIAAGSLLIGLQAITCACAQEPATPAAALPAAKLTEPRVPADAAPADAAPGVTAPAPSPGVRRAIIICGLAGDADHRKLFGDSIELLVTGLTTNHGLAAENVELHWGDEVTEMDGPGLRTSKGVATRESLAASAEALRASLGAEDSLWVFVFGHSHFDGRHSWLNIEGPDLNNQDFGRMFEGLRCREQVFAITTSASGFYLKSLAAPGRVVIVATEPDLEVNETLFPHRFVRGIASPPPYLELDIDRDGRLSLLDVYLWTARETAQEYVTGMLLATEHSLIDDTGDGRGTEVQINYLTEEQGGRRRAADDWPAPPTGDGALARKVRLSYPPAPPVPDDQAQKPGPNLVPVPVGQASSLP